MEIYVQELRHTLRGLLRQPGLTLGAVAALALGIGATTTMFSIVHGGTRNLPFAEPRELMVLTNTIPRRGVQELQASPAEFVYWMREQKSFEGIAAFQNTAFNLNAEGARPERRNGAWITPNTFQLLGVQPVRGRLFTDEDARGGTASTVLLSYDLWQARFSANPGLIGRTIRLNGGEYNVVGIMPKGFGFPVNAQLWLPLGFEPLNVAERGFFTVFGRLRDDATRDQASAELALLAQQMQRADPKISRDRSARVFPFVELEMEPSLRWFLYLMLGAVSFVLLIACANVANLLLARAATRAREMAIRAALGAGRARIVRQQLFESLAIATAGGLLGVLAANAGVQFFARATASVIEAFWQQFEVDGLVLGVSIALTAIAALAAGLFPALQGARTDPGAVLKNESQALSSLRLGRFSRALVVVQVALACGLMAVSSIFVQSALQLRRIPFPFSTRDVFTADLAVLPGAARSDDARLRFARDVLERTARIPGVQSVAFLSALPGRGAGNTPFLLAGEVEEAGQSPRTSGFIAATPGFLNVLQSRVQRGRDFSWADGAAAPPVMLVNESWVNSFSLNKDPTGQRVTVLKKEYTIVGVVPDLQVQDIQDRGGAGMYVPMDQAPFWVNRFVARVNGDPTNFVAPFSDAIETIDPDMPLVEPMSLHAAIYNDKKVLDVFGILFAAFGVGALLLTITGLYGVISFSVSSRTREFGIRLAMGARRIDLIRMVLQQGGRQLALGFAIGGTLAFALGKAAASTVDFITGVDPRAFGVVIVTLALTGLLALYSPARRAAGVQPLEALRHE